jgi:hypothetical protein
MKTAPEVLVTSVATLIAASTVQAKVQYSSTSLSFGDAGYAFSWEIDSSATQIKFSYWSAAGVKKVGLSVTAVSPDMKFVVDTNIKLLALGASVSKIGSGLGLKFSHKSVTVLVAGQLNAAQLNGFTSGTTEYIGFSFQHNSIICYGWAEITITANAGGYGTFTINDWAYEDTGAAITVGNTGAVPEPAETAIGLGALALGAAGLRRWRKGKAAKAA